MTSGSPRRIGAANAPPPAYSPAAEVRLAVPGPARARACELLTASGGSRRWPPIAVLPAGSGAVVQRLDDMTNRVAVDKVDQQPPPIPRCHNITLRPGDKPRDRSLGSTAASVPGGLPMGRRDQQYTQGDFPTGALPSVLLPGRGRPGRRSPNLVQASLAAVRRRLW